MRDLGVSDLNFCKQQGEFFFASISLFPDCSSRVFVRRFMNSDLAKRLDHSDYALELFDRRNYAFELEEQYGSFEYGNEKTDGEILYWMGYIYRYWSILYEMPSSKIFRLFPSKKMEEVYEAYHTLDPKMAIDRILEAIDYKAIDPTDPVSTLEIMKRVRKI